MELMFETKSAEFWEKVAQETLLQEETAELIVPDSFPDADRIVDCWAEILLRSKECRAGSISVSGTLQAGLLFLAQEKDVPQLMECSIPFTVRLDRAELTTDCFADYDGWVKGVDARVLNSRKTMIRVNVCHRITAWQQEVQKLPVLKEKTEDLQLKESEYPVLRTFDVAERSLNIQEETELPAGFPEVEKVLSWSVRFRNQETKGVGTRVAFRGNLELQLLYLSPEEQLQCWQTALGYTQFVEMNRDVDAMMASLAFCITGRDLQLGDTRRRLYLNLNLLVQAKASAYENLPLLEDLYSTRYDLTPQWQLLPISACLDRRVLQQTLRETVPIQTEQIERGVLLLDQPRCGRDMDGLMQIRIPMTLQLLCRDEAGALRQASGALEAEFSVPAAEQCSCAVSAKAYDLYVSPAAGGVEVRCTVEASASFSAREELQCVCAAACTERKADPDRPAILLRRMTAGESLWQIAKSSNTAVQTLMAANELQQEEVQPGTMLLIPVQ